MFLCSVKDNLFRCFFESSFQESASTQYLFFFFPGGAGKPWVCNTLTEPFEEPLVRVLSTACWCWLSFSKWMLLPVYFNINIAWQSTIFLFQKLFERIVLLQLYTSFTESFLCTSLAYEAPFRSVAVQWSNRIIQLNNILWLPSGSEVQEQRLGNAYLITCYNINII